MDDNPEHDEHTDRPFQVVCLSHHTKPPTAPLDRRSLLARLLRARHTEQSCRLRPGGQLIHYHMHKDGALVPHPRDVARVLSYPDPVPPVCGCTTGATKPSLPDQRCLVVVAPSSGEPVLHMWIPTGLSLKLTRTRILECLQIPTDTASVLFPNGAHPSRACGAISAAQWTREQQSYDGLLHPDDQDYDHAEVFPPPTEARPGDCMDGSILHTPPHQYSEPSRPRQSSLAWAEEVIFRLLAVSDTKYRLIRTTGSWRLTSTLVLRTPICHSCCEPLLRCTLGSRSSWSSHHAGWIRETSRSMSRPGYTRPIYPRAFNWASFYNRLSEPQEHQLLIGIDRPDPHIPFFIRHAGINEGRPATIPAAVLRRLWRSQNTEVFLAHEYRSLTIDPPIQPHTAPGLYCGGCAAPWLQQQEVRHVLWPTIPYPWAEFLVAFPIGLGSPPLSILLHTERSLTVPGRLRIDGNKVGVLAEDFVQALQTRLIPLQNLAPHIPKGRIGRREILIIRHNLTEHYDFMLQEVD